MKLKQNHYIQAKENLEREIKELRHKLLTTQTLRNPIVHFQCF